MVDILQLRKLADSGPAKKKPVEKKSRESVDAGSDSNSEYAIDAAIAEARKEQKKISQEPKDQPVQQVQAAPQTPPEGSASLREDETRDFVVFKLGDQSYALGIEDVQEVVRLPEITRVPNAASYVAGVMNLRGQITPVIDLHARFDIDASEWSEKTRIVVLRVHDQTLGFLVDRVAEIVRVPSSQIDLSTSTHTKIGKDYVRGVVKHESSINGEERSELLILLSLEAIFEEEGQGEGTLV